MTDDFYFLAPLSTLVPSGLATYLPLDADTIAAIDAKVKYADAHLISQENGLGFTALIVVTGELSLEFPWLAGTALVIGSAAGLGRTSFRLGLFASDQGFVVGIDDIQLSLRLPPQLLKPAPPEEGVPAPPFAEISVRGGVEIDQGLNLRIHGFDRFSLSPVMIGDTGIIISANDVKLDLSPTETIPEVLAAGFDESFVGVFVGSATVKLPQGLPALAPEDLVLQNCAIGTGGVSGRLAATYSPTFDPVTKRYTGRGASELFSIPFALFEIELEFRQNSFVKSRIIGKLLLPFFDEYVDVEIALNSDGSLTARLSAPDGLITFTKPNLLRMKLESIAFELKEGVFTTKVAGEITPLFGLAPGVEWPSFKVSELSIDSQGNIHLEGGWLNLREKYEVNFHGFKLEISKLGFGNTEDGSKWIGFSGGVKLVAGMPAGASVEGLRITWREGQPGLPKITLKGVRVDFEVPKALKFSGAVSYLSEVQRFEGSVKLDLIALKMQVDATAVFGVRDGQTYLAIYLAAEFPAGIPLFATGLGVYGMAGLFAMNMEPNRQPTQPWYEINSPNDWYHNPPPVGVTGLNKWANSNGSMAFGAGVTLGTVADNGHTFSGKMLLAIIFPGPILLIQGSASILQERTKLDSDANFRALGVLDGRAGTLLLGLDAQYRYDDSGALIDIRGAAQGFFNFNNPQAWFLNVGQKEPRERRLTARFFQLFDSYSYLMLDSQQLAMGAWIGFEQQWQFGPLGVALEAWIDGNARVSWKPAHFYGDLSLHGSVRLSVFGFTAGLTVDAGIKADVFDPFHVVGDFSVAIDLPWPFSDIAVNITLEWGPLPTPPPLPLPLKEVAVEHFKGTVSWPLPRIARSNNPALLLPNYDDGKGFLKPLPKPPAPQPPIVPANLDQLPIVPLDSRPHVTFGRNIHDEALVGVNAQPVIPAWEQIGDPVTKEGPARVKYVLEEVVLEKLTNPFDPNNNDSWAAVARKGKTPNDPGVPTLYGSWAPMPQMPGGGGQNVGQVKLWLWSKTPFEYTRRTTRAWDEWFNDRFESYPCSSIPDVCWDFEQIAPASGLPSPWSHPAEDAITVSCDRPNNISIIALSEPLQGFTHALCLSIPDDITIDLPQPTDVVRIRARDVTSVPAIFSGHNASGQAFRAKIINGADGPYFEIHGQNMIGIDIVYSSADLPSKPLAKPVAAAIGCQYIPSRNQLVFVEFNGGTISVVDLTTGQYSVLGTGYTKPEDIVVTADGTKAYVTERVGTLVRVELAPGRADRAKAVVITSGMQNPNQIFLDEERRQVYVVEYSDIADGRVLRIDLEGPGFGKHIAVVMGLIEAVGLLVMPDRNIAFVSEQFQGGRIFQVDLTNGFRTVIIDNLPSLFFLRWGDAERKSILVPVRSPGSVRRINLDMPGTSEVIVDNVPDLASSVALLPDQQLAVCSDTVVTAYRFEFCMLSICDIRAAILVRHMNEELVRWSQAGEVLEPHSRYRLKIKTFVSLRGEKELSGYSQDEFVTEYAYFRTDGPPGVAALTAPIGSEVIPTDKFASGLDDLTRYVSQTVPRVPPPTPDNPLPWRLFYRAYDVGVEFDENYVDLMYRLGRRDLTIQFFDGNGPALNDQGLRMLLANPWGRMEQVTLTEREERWLYGMTSTGCAVIDTSDITRNSTLQASSEAHLFPPSALCEARLVPALLHEDFGGYLPGTGTSGPSGSFGHWRVHDDAGSPENSRWEIAEGSPPDMVLVQKNNAATKIVWADAPDLPPTNPEQPGNWTNYRFSTYLRSAGGTIGVVFRYKDPAQHYRFVMDRENRTRKLIRFPGGESPPLAQDSFTYEANRDYLITVEAIGPSLRICLDGDLVFAVSDSALSAGQVGLYCAGTQTARFTDARVDDLRITAPVVYRFSFLTSRFKNFTDHLGSFEGKAWRAEVSPTANIAPLIAAAVSPGTPLTDSESRAYDSLVTHLLATVTAQSRSAVQVTRVQQSGQAIAFFVQSPEPLDWKRISLQLLRADLPAPPPTSPAIPTTGVTPKAGAAAPNYTPVTARILRKADGSGFFIIVPVATPPGSLLPPALYRLVLIYRRNNRALDSNSEIFSEAGNSAAEQATLDIPWQTQL